MLVTEDVLFEGLQLGLNLLLFFGQSRIVRTILRQRLTQHVVGLVNLTQVTVHREVILHRHRCGIVQIRGHHRLTTQERLQIGVLHPEQRIFRSLTAKVVLAYHHRTHGLYLAVERRVGIIEISTLFQVIHLHLCRGNITVVNTQLAVTLFIEDVIVVQHGPHLNLGRIGKHLVTVQAIFIDGDVAVQRQFEDIGKQVQLFVNRLYRVVETCIGIIVEVNLTIDVTTPNDILGHLHSSRKRQTSTHRHSLTLRRLCLLLLLGFLLLLLSTSLRLSTYCSSHQRYHQ